MGNESMTVWATGSIGSTGSCGNLIILTVNVLIQ